MDTGVGFEPTNNGFAARCIRPDSAIPWLERSLYLKGRVVMTIGLVFWIVMLLWLVWGVWRNRANLMGGGDMAIEFLLFLLLGWAAFGPPIRG